MQTTIPGTEISVSRLCFGCWGIATDFHWGERDEGDSIAAINAAFDAGVNFFDTAAVYSEGASEQLLGKVLVDRRDQVVIASKALPTDMAPADLIAGCEASLQRLGTDYLDLYQTHWSGRVEERPVPLAETWQAMQQLKQQGKVRHIGVCNAGVLDLDEYAAVEQPITNQLPHNLLWRAIEEKIVPSTIEKGMGILSYSPLMHGLLADKYQTAAEVPDGRARSRHFPTERELARHGEPGQADETFAAIAAIRDLCTELNRPMSDVALSWCLQKPGVSSVIVGVRNASQIRANIDVLENPVSAEVMSQLDRITEPLRVALGDNPDMWQGSGLSRYR